MIDRFLLGLAMFIGGGYLLLNAIQVDFNYGLYRFGNVSITTGYVLIPFMLGVLLMFMNHRSLLGWLIAGGSLVMLVMGVITNTHMRLRAMTGFELIIILVLTVGGLGLMLGSMRNK